MTKLELLNRYSEMAWHNVFCYSRNYAMTQPKEGFEKEWEQANEECKLLDEMIAEVAQEVPVLGEFSQIESKSSVESVPLTSNPVFRFHLENQRKSLKSDNAILNRLARR